MDSRIDKLFNKSFHLSGNACQDCAKRKLEENGIEASKKLRPSDTGKALVLSVGSLVPFALFVGVSVNGLCLVSLGPGWKE